MSNLVLIPARMASTRLPDKPLADIHGAPMIVHVWRRAVQANAGPVMPMPLPSFRVIVGDALADAAAEARATTPVAPAATPVAASSTPADGGAQPPPPPPAAPPRVARVEALPLDGNPERRITADELAALRASRTAASLPRHWTSAWVGPRRGPWGACA